jgi:hypothetical protein
MKIWWNNKIYLSRLTVRSSEFSVGDLQSAINSLQAAKGGLSSES